MLRFWIWFSLLSVSFPVLAQETQEAQSQPTSEPVAAVVEAPTSEPATAPAPTDTPAPPELPAEVKGPNSLVSFSLSLGTTAASIGMLAASFDLETFTLRQSPGFVASAFGLLLIGPSTGHVYSGKPLHALLFTGLRTGALALIGINALLIQSSGDNGQDTASAFFLAGAGGASLALLALYDVIDAPFTAKRRRQKKQKRAEKKALSWQLSPMPLLAPGGDQGWGLGARGSF